MVTPSSFSSTKDLNPFAEVVQSKIADRFPADDFTIVVPRFQGRNGKVKLEITSSSDADDCLEFDTMDVDHSAKEPFNLKKWRGEIQQILNAVLQKCNVRFGRITLIVRKRVFTEAEFSERYRADEPNDKDFDS